MQTSSLTFSLLLCMSLVPVAAGAEAISIPDSEERQGMTYEEYSKYREKMRMQMEQISPGDKEQETEPSADSSEKAEKSQRDSTFGQGYHSRKRSEDKPDTSAKERPERPRVERFNRGDMGRR